MKRNIRIVLIVVAVVSFGIALSYPILYERAAKKNNETMEDLSRMRTQALNEEAGGAGDASGADTEENKSGGGLADSVADRPENTDNQNDVSAPEKPGTDSSSEDKDSSESPAGENDKAEEPEQKDSSEGSKDTEEPESEEKKAGSADKGAETEEKEAGSEKKSELEETESESGTEEEEEEYIPTIEDFLLDYVPGMTWRQTVIPEYEEHDAPVLLGRGKPAENRDVRANALPYNLKEKVKLDEDKILPELKAIYKLNKDLRGWLVIDGTPVDYPVVQRKRDNEYYLHHDFYGKDNENGQLILDSICDPYTPSYNLVISGHHMRNGSMFGSLDVYKQQSYWENHKYVTFDTLMRRGTYVIIAAFYSADYDENEKGFRYNVELVYKRDVDQWLGEVEENNIYDNELDAEFGDEFLTLTTCDHTRRNDGRFVLICRRLREGEVSK